MQALLPDMEITDTSIVHLLRDEDEPEHAPGLERAEVIFAQLVADAYPCSFVRTSVLRERYGERVRVWPNLFHSGYNPELTYLRGPDRRPRRGPLGDYHMRPVVEAWREGRSVEDAAALVTDVEANRERFETVPAQSLAELRRREEVTDLRIVDWMEANQWSERLFFTFNHPAWRLITETARRLVSDSGLATFEVDALERRFPWSVPEPLGQFRLPVNAWVAAAHPLSFEDETIYQGDAVAGFGRPGESGRRHEYGLIELVGAYYSGYDADPAGLRDGA
jgi:hypothetical protein